MSTIKVSELAEYVKRGGQEVLIVDVRQHDYTTGKIKNSVNIPFDRFPQPAIQQIMDIVSTKQPSVIVTHCHYCQSRGPKSARMLLESGMFTIPVLYLTGGWDAWYECFHDNTSMIEDL